MSESLLGVLVFGGKLKANGKRNANMKYVVTFKITYEGRIICGIPDEARKLLNRPIGTG